MSTIVKPLPHDLAVVTALDSALGSTPVEFGREPDGALAALKATPAGPDYIIVRPISSGRDGSLGDPFSDGRFTYQFDIVGRLPDGVRYLAGEIEAALAGAAITGRVVSLVEPLTDGRVLADFDVEPPIFTAQPEYALHTVPA